MVFHIDRRKLIVFRHSWGPSPTRIIESATEPNGCRPSNKRPSSSEQPKRPRLALDVVTTLLAFAKHPIQHAVSTEARYCIVAYIVYVN